MASSTRYGQSQMTAEFSNFPLSILGVDAPHVNARAQAEADAAPPTTAPDLLPRETGEHGV